MTLGDGQPTEVGILLDVPINEDIEDMPVFLCNEQACPKCNTIMIVLDIDCCPVLFYPLMQQDYKMSRIRFELQCPKCRHIAVYRLAFKVSNHARELYENIAGG